MTQITDYNEFHIINEGLNYWLFALLVLFVLSTKLRFFFLQRPNIYLFSYEEILFTKILKDFKWRKQPLYLLLYGFRSFDYFETYIFECAVEAYCMWEELTALNDSVTIALSIFWSFVPFTFFLENNWETEFRNVLSS